MSCLLNQIILPDGQTLPDRILPGPMDGVTTGAFLTAMAKRGWVKAWITPFLRISTGVPHLARLREWLAPYQATAVPVIAQIMGTNTERLAQTAERLKKLGACAIDLNCACPSPTVVGNHSGGARLLEPDWLPQTVYALKNACGNLAIGLKIRCGFSSPDELPQLLNAIKRCPPDVLTVHFRTVSEMYRPVPNGLQRLLRVRQELPQQFIVGSGDLFTPQHILDMEQQTGVQAVAPARGLLANPALLQDTRDFLNGMPTKIISEQQKIAFLTDLANPEGLSPKTQNGFVLRMTKNLLGENHQIFRDLVKIRNIRQTFSYLSGNFSSEKLSIIS